MQEIQLKNFSRDFRTNEAYKTLRTNIEFAGVDKQVIVITSCTPNEGKSIVSLALAQSLAESGKKVIFVDADLRKSVLIGRLDITTELKGLSHFLSGQAQLKEVITKTQQGSLMMVFAGAVPPNPAELLGGKRFEAFLEWGRKNFDYVIIDAPPLGSVIDAAVIAKNSDASILVIESGLISRRFVWSVKEQLERAGCPILGVVLNKVNVKKSSYYSKYYKNYYTYEEYKEK